MDRKGFLKKTCQLGVLSSCASVCGFSAYSNLMADDDKKGSKPANPNETTCEDKTKAAKRWVKRFMETLDKNIDEPTRIALMKSNGKACFIQAHGKSSGPFSDGKNHIDEFVNNVKNRSGDPNSIRVEGDTIYFYYVSNPKGLKVEDGYCLCPIVEDGPEDLSPTYCYCSVGYVTEMFRQITNKEVVVELKESLRRGGKKCRFEIKIL